jgi:Cu+-exporting ATPase
MNTRNCHVHHDHEHDHTQHDAALLDPVCGMTVDEDAPHRAEYAGRIYRFCSAGCRT